MRQFFVFFAFVFLASCSESPSQQSPPHFELDMTGPEYQRHLSENPEVLNDPDFKILKPILDLGKRNLDWLIRINQGRAAGNQISLTSEATMRGYPIDRPREYNVRVILGWHRDLLKKMPQAMAKVLTGSEPLPANPTLTEADYIFWGNETDQVYQVAARWLMLKKYRQGMIDNRRNDIRGYYFLIREPELAQRLDAWAELSPADQAKYREWLIGTCGNANELLICTRELDEIIAKKDSVRAYWEKYRPFSQDIYESNFEIQWERSDIRWTSAQPEFATIPFVDPKNEKIATYLKENVEAEWKWGAWQLLVQFQNGSKSNMSHIEFEPNVTAHVKVPNTIVMDENQPTTEYDSRWTIRHEFGHILGFPDCYIEFYDVDRELMISYQIDITNLMCSRRGKLKQTHFDEMKRVYLDALEKH